MFKEDGNWGTTVVPEGLVTRLLELGFASPVVVAVSPTPTVDLDDYTDISV